MIYRDFGISNEINVELNNTCNLSCPLCPVTTAMNRPKGYMSFELWQKLAHELANLQIIDVDLIGFGEPLLHRCFSEIVHYGADLGLQIRTSTNATILSENMIEKLILSGLNEIIVCIDGSNPRSHEIYRVGSKFEKVVDGVKKLVDRRNQCGTDLKITMQTLITKYSEEEMPKIKQLATDLGVDNLRFKLLSLGTYLPEKERRRLATYWLPNNDLLSRYSYSNDSKPTYKHNSPSECPWWTQPPFILWNGDVTTCCYDYDGVHTFASLKEQSLMTILENMSETRQLVKQRKLPLCFKCQIANGTIKKL